VGDTVQNNFLRRRPGPLNRVLLCVAVQQDIHFRHFGNPTAIDLALKLDRELHSHRLPPPRAEQMSDDLAGRPWLLTRRGLAGLGVTTMGDGQLLATSRATGVRSIAQIVTKSLFGYFDYTLRASVSDEWSAPVILYGDNGSGKTTILELLFHLLSPAPNRGHRNAIAKIPFKMFQVVLTDGTSVTAARAAERLIGGYAMIAERSGDRIADCIFDPSLPDKFSPPDTEKEFLGFLKSLNLAIY